ncbi:MAG: Fic family protein [Spirochaetia bacterium]|jgi:cell filamentation protein|nr:Fic family protein [Spirochaetia bacterium]
MVLGNKLGISDAAELARVEERLSKSKAYRLFTSGLLDTLKPGSFEALAAIHRYLFEDVCDFAGIVRTVNIAKGNFRFAPVMYLEAALQTIEAMPLSTVEQIIEKYVEMNIAHPFREGNGRNARIWLDLMLKKEVRKVVDWNRVDKNDYLMAMERRPVKDVEIKALLSSALTAAIYDATVYMKGIDASYYYEGYNLYKAEDLYL